MCRLIGVTCVGFLCCGFEWFWDSSAASGDGLGVGSSAVVLEEKKVSSGSVKLMLMSIISGCS